MAPLFAVHASFNHQIEWLDLHGAERGPVTAAAFASTIDDVNRFGSAHQLEAYLGLTPSEMISGERT